METGNFFLTQSVLCDCYGRWAVGRTKVLRSAGRVDQSALHGIFKTTPRHDAFSWCRAWAITGLRVSEADYGKNTFTRGQFTEMAELLANIKGRFILSLNDRPEVR